MLVVKKNRDEKKKSMKVSEFRDRSERIRQLLGIETKNQAQGT